METTLVTIINVILVLIYIFLIVPIGLAIFFLIRQQRFLADFNPEAKILDRSEYYISKGIVNPSYVEEDISADLDRDLDPYGGWLNLIISRLSILGLLGTFLGLSKALPHLREAINDSSKVDALIAGASNAFITSIIGLLGALIISYFYRAYRLKIDAVFHKIKNSVFDRMFAGKSVSNDLSTFVAEIKTSFADNVAELSKHLGSSYNDLKTWSSQLVADKTEMMAGLVEKSDARLVEVIGKLNDERKAINDVKRNWNAAIEQLYKSSKNVASMSQNVDNFAKLSQQLIEKVDEFSTGFQEQIYLMAELNEKSSKPSELMNTLSILLAENLNQNKKIYEITEANQSIMENAVEKIVTDVDGMTGKLVALFNGVKANFDSQLQAVEKANELSREQMTVLVEGIKSNFENQMAMIERSGSQTQEQLRETLKQTNEQFIGSLNALLESFTTSVMDGNSRLSQSIKTSMENLSSRFPDQKEELNKLVTNMVMLDYKLKRAFEYIINQGIRTR
jgi:biopolymer transport protein ExbB/TolQ/molybdopterin converting factor small subunit